MSEPTPGSDCAVKQGCTCPVPVVEHGRGAYQIDGVWVHWIAPDCPLHGQPNEETPDA